MTLGCVEVPRMETTGFGVMHVDEEDTIIDFVEKSPPIRRAFRAAPDQALASMGIYVFETKFRLIFCAVTPLIRILNTTLAKYHPYLVKMVKPCASLLQFLRDQQRRADALLARRGDD